MKRLFAFLLCLLVVTSISARPFGASVTGGGGSFAFTTGSTLTSGTLGNAYSNLLAYNGNTGTVTCNEVAAAPNTGIDFYVLPNCTIYATSPQYAEQELITVQANDSAHPASPIQKQFSINVSASGALAIKTTTTLAAAPNGGLSAFKLNFGGGQPNFYMSAATAIQTNNNISCHWDGWCYAAPTSTGTISLPISVIDQNGATVSQTESITVNNTLAMGGVDQTDTLMHMPQAYVGSLWRAPLQAFAGGGTYTFSCTANCPSGGSFTGSLYSFTPTVAGAIEPTFQVSDGTTTKTATALINVSSSCNVTRPSYNTGGGYFVKGGAVYDSNGNCFQMVGENQTHDDGAMFNGVGVNAAKTGANVVRCFCFNGLSASAMVTYANANYLANDMVPMIVGNFYPVNSNLGCGSTGPTDNSTTYAGLACMVQYEVSAEPTLASIMNKIMINIANEWGGGSDTDAFWAAGYLDVTVPVTSISGTTLNLTSSAGTNPFAAVPFAYITCTSGITNQVVLINATGGTSGAWTATSGTSLGTSSSGCMAYGGAIGALRGAGYTSPLVIDAGGGQNLTNLYNYGAALEASDPQGNIIESAHLYNVVDNYSGLISNMVSSGSSTVVTLVGNLPYHPFVPSYPNVNSNNYIGNGLSFVLSGVTGTMSALNGLQPSNPNVCNITACSAGSWNVNLGTISTGFTFGGGGSIITSNNYAYVIGKLAALKASNVPVIIGEYAVSGNDAGGPMVGFNASTNSGDTQLTVSSMIAGSAPILPNMSFATASGTNCGAIGTLASGTQGGVGVYNVINNGIGTCPSASGVFTYLPWGTPPATVPASQIIAAALANGLGVFPWSFDDHNPDGASFGLPTQSAIWNFGYAFAPTNASTCTGTTGAGCWVLPSDLAPPGQDAIENPRYGSLAISQKGTDLH